MPPTIWTCLDGHSMTRIIGGSAGGRRLKTPHGTATRPTSDRVREALFSALESWAGNLAGLRVLDLYAGTGALGLEAMSRGAGVLTAVESDRRTAQLILTNASTLGFKNVTVETIQVAKLVAHPPRAPYDVILLDPPYPMAAEEVDQTLAELSANGWIGAGAIVVVERSARSVEPTWPDSLSGVRKKEYGETVLWYVHADPDQA